MRIAIGSLQCESNTLSPVPTREGDFDRAYGRAMCDRVHVMDLLEGAGAEAVPTLYAHALPGGAVAKGDYLRLARGVVDALPETGLDGVWLYLHGAMYVEMIGGGEAHLLRLVRQRIGPRVPIALALDFHANNEEELMELADVICAFRTAPHVDQVETERKAMRLLLRVIEKKLAPRPRMARADVVIPGDAVQTAQPPLDRIMAMADEMEKLPGMLCAQVFGGQSWVDAPFMGPSMVVTHERDERLAQSCADQLARAFYDARYDFTFLIDALEPDEAIRRALEADEAPVFLSDSGDNTTAGAAGDSAFLLNRLIALGARDTLVAGLADEAATLACYDVAIGDTLTLTVGGSLDKKSERATVAGRLTGRGDILGYTGALAGKSATLELDCGITLVLTERRTAITSLAAFQSISLDILPYKLIVVKLGYLFPGLQALSKKAVLALTPGGSTERLEDMGHTRIRRPMYPLDDHFL